MTAPDPRPPGHLPGLHGLRGIAALAVMVLHLASTLSQPLRPWLGWWVSDLGLAVQLFFVLSAMVLIHTHGTKAGTPGWIRDYAIKRVFRIAPLFYAVLALSVLSAGGAEPWVVLLNLTFLFNLVPEQVMSLVPTGWAVGVEMLFYVLLPLVILRVRSMRAALWLWAASALVSLLCHLLLPAPYSWMSLGGNAVFFASGVVAIRAIALPASRRVWTGFGWSSVLGVALVAAFVAGPEFDSAEPQAQILLWVLPFAGLCAWQARHPSRWLCSAPMQWLGDRSFSLYLVHPETLSAVAPLLQLAGIGELDGDAALLLSLVVVLAVLLPVADAVHRLIELPGQRMGRALIRRLG